MADSSTLSILDTPPVSLDLGRGSWVRVRPLDEILATLDADGKLEGVPFMPEMVPFCSRTLRVHRRAERTCVEGAGVRRMDRAVFLEGARCNGLDHAGCQRQCMFFWKEAWLLPAGQDRGPSDADSTFNSEKSHLPTVKGERYFCQSTELAGATHEHTARNLSCYLHDLMTGETRLCRVALTVWLGIVNRVWRLVSSREYFVRPAGMQKRTPSVELNLKPGELVEVKSLAEITKTLDADGRNRGMYFDPEMGLHCGKRYRVLAPIHRMISEETGKMIALSNTVLLEGLTCEGIGVCNCPRAHYPFWRECWLKRIDESPKPA